MKNKASMNRITRPSSLLKGSTAKIPSKAPSYKKTTRNKGDNLSREKLYNALTKTALEDQIKVMNNKKNF